MEPRPPRLTSVRTAAFLVFLVACGPRQPATPSVSSPSPDAAAPTGTASSTHFVAPNPRTGCQPTPEATQGAACGDAALCTFTDPASAGIRCFCRETNPANGPASISPKAYACIPQYRADGCPTEVESATPCAPAGRKCVYGPPDDPTEITCEKKLWSVTRYPRIVPRP
jgi:hypothetical protein